MFCAVISVVTHLSCATRTVDLLQAAQTKYDGIKFEGDPRKRQRVMITFTIPASKLNKLVPNDVKIGPIELNGTDTILTMEAKIKVRACLVIFIIFIWSSNVTTLNGCNQ